MAMAIPMVMFTAFLVWLLIEMFRGFEDVVPRRAGVTWAITCPGAGLLFGVGLAPLAAISGAVSVLALGSLAFWFLAASTPDNPDEASAPVEPDPSPSADVPPEPEPEPEPELEPEPEPVSGIDWDAFDRAREEWEREFAPKRETVPQKPAVEV